MKITNNLPNSLNVYWQLTSTCNYSCWYCPDHLHDGKFRWPDLEASLDFFQEVSRSKDVVHLDIGGGEPTLWPELEKFLQRLPGNYEVEVSSNGSRSLSWWQKNYSYMKGTCLTFHPDSADPERFFELCRELSRHEDKNLHVFILTVENKLEVCQALYKRLFESGFAMSCRAKVVDDRTNTNAQRINGNNLNRAVIETLEKSVFSRIRPAAKYVGKPSVAMSDGVPFDYSLTPLYRTNRYKGWTCMVGVTKLMIMPSGDIYRGSCRNGGKIGNIMSARDIYNIGPTICAKEVCECLDEVIVEKHSSDELPDTARI